MINRHILQTLLIRVFFSSLFFLLLALLNLPQPVAAQSASSLVAYWKMEEGNGNIVVDSSGHGHDQHLTGNPLPAWSTDVPTLNGGNGHSLAFTGGNYSYAHDVAEMTNATQLTVEAWVKRDGFGTGTLVSADQLGFQSLWFFDIENNNELYVRIPNAAVDNGQTDAITVGANLQPGQWDHVALVYDGSGTTNADRLKIFVNGQAAACALSGHHSLATFERTTDGALGI